MMERSGQHGEKGEGKGRGDSSSLPPPSKPPASTGHRSRKEKLVVRSFSTETDEGGMEPRILSHEEFYASTLPGKRGARNRRTVSAPIPPSDHHLKVKTESGNGEGGTSPTSESPPSRMRSNTVSGIGGRSSKEGDDLETLSPPPPSTKVKEKRVKGMSKSSSPHATRKYTYAAGMKRRGRPPKDMKRRMEWTATSSSSPPISETLSTPSSSNSTPGTSETMLEGSSSSSLLKSKYSSSNATTTSSSTKSVLISPGKVLFKVPEIPVTQKDDGAEEDEEEAPESPPAPAPPPTEGGDETLEGADSKKRYIPKPTVPDKTFAEFVENQKLSAVQRRLGKFRLLEKMSKIASMNGNGKGRQFLAPSIPDAAFTPPPPPPLQDQGEQEEHKEYTEQEKDLDYKKGYTSLMKLMDGYKEEGAESVAFTVPDLCREAISQLMKLLAFPSKKKRKTDLEDAMSSSGEDSSIHSDSETDKEDDSSTQTLRKFISYAREQLKVSEEGAETAFVNENEIELGSKFVMGSYFSQQGPNTSSRLTEEELQVFKELTTSGDDNFEIFEDEQEIVNLWMAMVLSDLRLEKNEKKMREGMDSILKKRNEEESPTKTISVNPIKITPELKGMYPSDVILNVQDFVSKCVAEGKENQLQEFTTRTLRNGKKVRLGKFSMFSKKRKDTRSQKIKRICRGGLGRIDVTQYPPTMKEAVTIRPRKGLDSSVVIGKNNSMKLRSGTQLPCAEKSGVTRFLGGIAQMHGIHIPEILREDSMGLGKAEGEKGEERSPTKDEYAQRVEANLRQLQAGGQVEFSYSCSDNKEDKEGAPSAGMEQAKAAMSQDRCRTGFIGKRKIAVDGGGSPLPYPIIKADGSISPCNYTYGPDPFGGPPCYFIPNNESVRPLPTPLPHYFPYPIPPQCQFQYRQKGPGGSLLQNSYLKRRGLLSSTTKNRYSRYLHATLCPPFDNNHCSFSNHYCSYPRAPGSRFCINHVGEGATLNFARCQYGKKDGRECGRYAPRSPLETGALVMCDLHSISLGKVINKLKTQEKSTDKTPGLLRHMRFNLDRAQGKVMESDGMGEYRVRRDFVDDERDMLNNLSGSDESDDGKIVEEVLPEQKGDEESDEEGEELEPNYEYLRTAGYFSVEECVKLARYSLVKQKQNMLEEIKILKRKYSLGFSQYIHDILALKRRRLAFSTDPKLISSECTSITEEQKLNELRVHNSTLTALNHRRNHGPREVLRQKVLRRRQDVFELIKKKTPTMIVDNDPGSPIRMTPSPLVQQQIPDMPYPINPAETEEEVKLRLKRRRHYNPRSMCIYAQGTTERCQKKALSLTRFCAKHIMEDPTQKLFTRCNFRLGASEDDVCPAIVYSELGKFGCNLHQLPVPPKDPPESQNRKPKVEEEIDKLLEELGMDSAGSEDESTTGPAPSTTTNATDEIKEEDTEEAEEEDIVNEMSQLVGDELVDTDHFREVISNLYKKGLNVTDSEESDDTDEEDEQPQANTVNSSFPLASFADDENADLANEEYYEEDVDDDTVFLEENDDEDEEPELVEGNGFEHHQHTSSSSSVGPTRRSSVPADHHTPPYNSEEDEVEIVDMDEEEGSSMDEDEEVEDEPEEDDDDGMDLEYTDEEDEA